MINNSEIINQNVYPNQLQSKKNVADSEKKTIEKPVLVVANTTNKEPKKDTYAKHVGDYRLPNNFSTNIKEKTWQLAQIPKYATRGLKGDQNWNFFEFLKLAEFPFYLGGLALIACFKAGGEKANVITQQKAVGVALFYVAAKLRNLVIDVPVKHFRGVDLAESYKHIQPGRVTSKDGSYSTTKENHNTYESIDFTRTDLLYDRDKNAVSSDKNYGNITNKDYNKIARKMGVKGDINDSDETVKGKLKQLIVEARTFKTLLLVPFSALAIGIGGEDKMGKFLFKGLWTDLKKAVNTDCVKDKSFPIRAKYVLTSVYNAVDRTVISVFRDSFKDFWKAQGRSSNTKALNRLVVLTSLLLPVLYNWQILRTTSIKDQKFVDKDRFPGILPKNANNEIKTENAKEKNVSPSSEGGR